MSDWFVVRRGGAGDGAGVCAVIVRAVRESACEFYRALDQALQDILAERDLAHPDR